MEKEVLYDIMIDPSLIVAKRTAKRTFNLVQKINSEYSGFKFYCSKHFYDFIFEYEPNYSQSLVFRFFLQNANLEDIATIKQLLHDNSERIVLFNYKPEEADEYYKIFRSLGNNLSREWHFYRGTLETFPDFEILLNILFDEWVFLQEFSLVVSRNRKTFNKFIDAGALCLQFSERYFEPLVRKTLKKDYEEPVSGVDKLRAIGKWIAVGGQAIMPFIKADPVVSFLSSLVTGYFLLVDPNAAENNGK